MNPRSSMLALEKKRLEEHIDQLRRNSETERIEQHETYQTEEQRGKPAKELADRDVLLESQNEKTWIVNLLAHNNGYNLLWLTREPTNFVERIEELEEALQKSVSITAEREVHLSQQKHLLHQVNQKLKDARRENAELRKQLVECGSGEHGQLIRAFEAERRQHIELLMQLNRAVVIRPEAVDSVMQQGTGAVAVGGLLLLLRNQVLVKAGCFVRVFDFAEDMMQFR
ncbi:hypothetical protein KIN20_028621 [Parelaphostrongylus tenuis]|uniref:Uncharacterized protein n=1 Tax=Parelaphostrongylus tenuis TaxID=148309 RepID=A0AAD5R146_PARTN|nr:hypothetical protein KIN20_028621 [Parelaphostrongylus tenuis]